MRATGPMYSTHQPRTGTCHPATPFASLNRLRARAVRTNRPQCIARSASGNAATANSFRIVDGKAVRITAVPTAAAPMAPARPPPTLPPRMVGRDSLTQTGAQLVDSAGAEVPLLADDWVYEMDVKGGLVEFVEGTERRLGILTSKIIHEDKYFVLAENGKELCIKKNQISFEWPEDGSLFGFHDLYSIRAHTTQQISAISGARVREVWKGFVKGNTQAHVTPSSVAALLNFSDEQSALYAAYRILIDNPIYFKPLGHNLFVCRSEQAVRQKSQKEERSAEELRFVRSLRARIRKALPHHPLPDFEGDDHTPTAVLAAQPLDETLLHQVKLSTITQFHNQSFFSRFVAPLGLLGHPKDLLALLEKLGFWKSTYDNPVLFRFTDLPTASFSPPLEELAAKLARSPPPLADKHWDLSALPVFTVDDPSTTDIDDGVSYERRPDGSEWVYIHIADPARYLLPQSELELSARTRATTIYLPERTIPMMPAPLVDACSLTAGKTNYALTFAARLDASGKVEDYMISPSILANVHKVSYASVDAILEGKVESEFALHFQRLNEIHHKRRSLREAQGAFIGSYAPQLQLKVVSDQIKMMHQLEKSRDIIAEYMILAGTLAAEYAASKQLPIPFRAQMKPRAFTPGQASESAFDMLNRAALSMPALVTPVASPHSALGLMAYTQATSPIRRYGDLLVHQQIKAILRGEKPPFTITDMIAIMNDVTHTLARTKRIEKLSERYWLLRYLEQTEQRSYRAVIIDARGFKVAVGKYLALVYLEDLNATLAVDLQLRNEVRKGDRLTLKVAAIDSLSDLLVMSQA